jgi:phosphonate ABC transporter permease subunit PhnE
MNKTPKFLVRTIAYLALISIGILVYAYGWKVTDINLEKPQDPQRKEQVNRALHGLLNPDLVERDTESQATQAYFWVPCTDTLPAQPKVAAGQPYITLSAYCGGPREMIDIEGFNFRPHSEGYVRWAQPGSDTARPLGSVRTDADGHFQGKVKVPTVGQSAQPQTVEAEISWPVGTPRPSEALKATFDRMIETVFLALMATTIAVPISVAVSFIAAYNIMRAVRMPLGGLLAALLPLPLGWVLGRQAFQPVIDVPLNLSNESWLGVPILAVLIGGLYFTTTERMPRLGPIRNVWLAGLARYGQMILVSALALFMGGLISGVGTQISLALSGILGGILGNILGSLAELLALLLPVFGGLAGILILGSLAGTLLEALLRKVNSPLIQRGLGLVLGALTGGLFLFLIYQGIYGFYKAGGEAPLTVHFAVFGAVAGGLLGLVLRADYQLPAGLTLYYVTRTVLNALRAVEPLIMAIVFSIWVGIGPFAGVLALTLHSIAALGKLYSEQVESIDPGPIEAITATGANGLQVIIYGVVPQIVPPYIAFTIYRWDINVRMSTIIGFVGGGGIGFIIQQWINLLQYRQAGVAMLAIAIVVATLDYASAKLREKIV